MQQKLALAMTNDADARSLLTGQALFQDRRSLEICFAFSCKPPRLAALHTAYTVCTDYIAFINID